MTRPLRVFLCHASQDKPTVWKLYRFLKQRGIQPWLDQADLLPGQHWEVEIPKAINTSDVILVCLSKNSVNKEGYVQREIVFALDKALEKPEGTIFIIPLKLEECDVPKRLSPYHWVDYYRPDGRKRLLLGLNKRATELGNDILPVILEETRQKKAVPSGKNLDLIGREAIEEPEHERLESETKEKEERESAKRVAIAKVVRDAKEFAETAEREGIENWEREVQNRETPDRKPMPKKPFTKLLTLSALSPQKVLSTNKVDKQYEKKRLFYRLGAFALISVFVLGLYALFPLFSEQQKATLTPTFLEDTETPKPPAASSATFTSTSQPIETPNQAPTLGIGSTMISEKDGMVLVYVLAGEFIMGSTNASSPFPVSDSEKPQHTVMLNAFWIDQTEVTTAMYSKCVFDGECKEPSNAGSATHSSYYDNDEFGNYPVIYVDWNMAKTYCTWANRRLPTEAEWEKAARGEKANIYPWGNSVPNNTLLNYNNNVGDTTEVGKYPNGASIYGALDMAGNVWEWVSSLPHPYPYNAGDGREDLNSLGKRELRGGSWLRFEDSFRSSYRDTNPATYTYNNLGFRCARSE